MPPFSVIKCLPFSDNPRCHSSLGNKLLPAAYRRASPEAPEFLSAPYIPVWINRLISPYRIPPSLSDTACKGSLSFPLWNSIRNWFLAAWIDMTELRYSSKILLCASTKVSNLKLSSTVFTSDLILLVPIILPQKGHYKYTNSIISPDLHIFFRAAPRSGLARYP